jgi:hypothetical protein
VWFEVGEDATDFRDGEDGFSFEFGEWGFEVFWGESATVASVGGFNISEDGVELEAILIRGGLRGERVVETKVVERMSFRLKELGVCFAKSMEDLGCGCVYPNEFVGVAGDSTIGGGSGGGGDV